MTAPTLTDGTVTLRAHRASDIDDVVIQGQDPRMQRWTTVPVPYEREHAESFVLEVMPNGWQTPTGSRGFAIEAMDGERPRFAGTVDFRPDGQRGAHIGYGLAPWARGRALGTAAVRLGLDWAFEALDLDVVHWEAYVGNWASRRVAWGVGFKVEGAVRGLSAARGERYDAWIGSLLRGDPRQPAKPWFDEPAVVDGPRVRLRPWRDEDQTRIVEACSDPESQRWLPHLPTPYGVEAAESFLLGTRTGLAEGTHIGWCVADRDTDECVGSMVVFNLAEIGQEAEVGYWAHPDARGRGYTREALELVVRQTFRPPAEGGLGLGRLALRAATGNVGSLRLARALGFREVGVQRRIDPQPDGSYDDLMVFDLLADEVSA